MRRLCVMPRVRPHPRAQRALLAAAPPLLRGVVTHALEQLLLEHELLTPPPLTQRPVVGVQHLAQAEQGGENPHCAAAAAAWVVVVVVAVAAAAAVEVVAAVVVAGRWWWWWWVGGGGARAHPS